MDVVIASDPYGVTHGVGEWLTDNDTGRAALGVFGRAVTIAMAVRDAEFVDARLEGDTYVYSCYVSPRPPLGHFQRFLQRLENNIRGLDPGASVVIGGDFNARSAAWGDWETCARGNELVAFADSLGLVILNRGSEPTFVARGAGAIVDVTFVSENMALYVGGWKVETSKDNGSDHQTINFHVSARAQTRVPCLQGCRWDTTKAIDMDLLKARLCFTDWIF